MVPLRGDRTISNYYDSAGEWQICVNNNRTVGSFGIFSGDMPFDFVLPATLFQLIVVILTSRMLYFLLRPLRTPKFISNVLGGILLGPTFLGRNKIYWEALFPARQAQFLIVISLLGSTYFLFIIALKMDTLITMRAAKSNWRLGVIPFFASFGIISTLLNVFYSPHDFPLPKSRNTLTATMAISNFPVVSEALTELNLIATELGQIALSSATMSDLIQFGIIITYLIKEMVGDKHFLLWFGSLLSFMLVSFFAIRPIMMLIARRTPLGKPVQQIYVVLILLGVLVMAFFSDLIGITIIIGPLIYGSMIPSGPPLGTTLVEKCEAVISEFLLPFFFVHIGMYTNLHAIHDWRGFTKLQSIFLAGDLVKVVACVLVSLTYNIKAKHGMVLGHMMNIKGITQLISFAQLKKLKLLDDQTFSSLVMSVVMTTSIVAPLVRYLYKHRPRVRNASSVFDREMSTIQSSPRDSEFCIVTCLHNEGNVCGITTLLEACNPVVESPLRVFVIHLVELFGKSAPILLPINYKQNRKFLSINYPNTNHIMRAFENYSNNSSGPVTILPYVNVAPYKSMHDAVCNLAQDNFVPLIIIPFHENDHIDLDGHVATSIRKLNARFQAHVPCTLGILVDRYSRLGLSKESSSKLYFHVGIFFIGGADDREALALGIRMSERENMKVSLFHFVVMNWKVDIWSKEELEEEEAEKMLDEGLVDEFKGKKYGSGNVSWYEFMVEDGVEVMDAIRSLEGDYDLVMVGRRHSRIGSFNDEEMANFIENAQILGTFGDMLSSTEFCIGMVPVLVTQYGGDKRVNKLDRVVSGSVSMSKRSLRVGK